jgi:hypothetical protein
VFNRVSVLTKWGPGDTHVDAHANTNMTRPCQLHCTAYPISTISSPPITGHRHTGRGVTRTSDWDTSRRITTVSPRSHTVPDPSSSGHSDTVCRLSLPLHPLTYLSQVVSPSYPLFHQQHILLRLLHLLDDHSTTPAHPTFVHCIPSTPTISNARRLP